MRKGFVSLFVSMGLLLSGCSLLPSGNKTSSQSKEEIKSFEMVTDSFLTTENDVYVLTMYVGDTYQLKSSIDDKLKDEYHFAYESVDEPKYTISETGLVTAKEQYVGTFGIRLIRNSDNKKMAYHSLVINIKEAKDEYATITLNDSSLDYDETTRTYSLSLTGGEEYHIATSIKYNVAYNKSFILSDESYSSFMEVDTTGLITTKEVNEDKTGQIIIQTKSADLSVVYDTVYLNVQVKKKEGTTSGLAVKNLASDTILKDGDKQSLYLHESMIFSVTYDQENKYDVMSISNENVLSLDNSQNKITAIGLGKSDVTFSVEGKSLTVEVEVVNNALIGISSKNEGDDFILVNGKMIFLGRMFATFASSLQLDITNEETLTYTIHDKDEQYKSVTFSYTVDGITKSVTYDVKYYLLEEYQAKDTSYDFSDYYTNRYQGNYYVLPKEGEIHMLVIPVWFSNSTSFFREDQKQEILQDLDYVFNSTRDKDSYYSVKQYYETESSGKLTLDCTISDFYTSNTSSLNYGDTEISDINRTNTLADDAITWYFANHLDESISDYDSNGDSLIDAVSLVYAANYYGRIGDSNGTTAFQFKNTNGSHQYNNGSFSPLGSIYGFNKTSTTYGKDVQDLSSYYPSYFFNTGGKTIIHETGHMFGMVDLYEDNHATTKYYPAGKFTMQSTNYGTHDPYQMNLVGWSKPNIYSASDYQVGEKVTLKIDDFASSGNNILLTRDWNDSDSLFDEYMLLELFAPTGLNYYEAKNSTTLGFDDAGIRLWHINSTLEDMTVNGKETCEIADNKIVNLKYSNHDQSSLYDLAHWIRNNPEEEYDTISSEKDSYGLFKSGDHFDMDTFGSQFVHQGKLDSQEKLGWEFTVDSIYQSVDETYGAIITLTRCDNTRTDFEFSSRVDKEVTSQPEDGDDYGLELLEKDDFSLIYHFNDASEPSYYTQNKPISYKGLCLFAASNGNGGSLVLSIKEKEGYQVLINSISITYSMLTKASLTALVNSNTIPGTSFTGPYNDMDEYNEMGKTYLVNNTSITLQNKYTQGTDYWSVVAIYSIAVNYHIEKI